MYCVICELPRALTNVPDGDPPSGPKVCPEAFPIKASDHSGVGTLLLLPSRGESRRIDLVMIDPTDREVFHHNATAAVAEHLCEAALTNTGHLRIS
jgi:hypothetical protein